MPPLVPPNAMLTSKPPVAQNVTYLEAGFAGVSGSDEEKGGYPVPRANAEGPGKRAR